MWPSGVTSGVTEAACLLSSSVLCAEPARGHLRCPHFSPMLCPPEGQCHQEHGEGTAQPGARAPQWVAQAPIALEPVLWLPCLVPAPSSLIPALGEVSWDGDREHQLDGEGEASCRWPRVQSREESAWPTRLLQGITGCKTQMPNLHSSASGGRRPEAEASSWGLGSPSPVGTAHVQQGEQALVPPL